MITVGMNYQIIEGKETIFEDAFRSVLGVMGSMEGHKKSNLFKDVDNQQSFLVVSEWHTREAFDEFISSEQFKRVTNWGKEQILAGRPKHDIYEN